MRQHFMMFAAYNRWANERLYAAAEELSNDEFVRDTGAFFGSVMATMNHLLVTDRIWMKRFTGLGDAPTSLDLILHRSLPVLRAARVAEDERISGWVGGLNDRAFSGRFTYTTVSDMRTISQRLAPALAHFFNHQTHHRGQIHAGLTGLGKPAVPLDLAFFQRTEEGRAYA
ncbi:MAG: damage-inducible protein DinB [Rhizobiaceae bacterium]|nr:damage-inducible protein DinB [Rhizobiaceae bacterium]